MRKVSRLNSCKGNFVVVVKVYQRTDRQTSRLTTRILELLRITFWKYNNMVILSKIA